MLTWHISSFFETRMNRWLHVEGEHWALIVGLQLTGTAAAEHKGKKHM